MRYPGHRNSRSTLRAFIWSVFMILALSSEARAYVDPGTGSYILQMVIAGLLGSIFTIKLFGKKIKAFIQQRFSGGRDQQEDDPTGEDE